MLGGVEAAIYRAGNAWQRDRYAFMAEYLARRGVRAFGRSSRGTAYRHLLTEAGALHNFLGDARILAAVRRRYGSHKAGHLERTLTNTTASTPFCFNLFVPLQENLDLAGALVSAWLGEAVRVAHLEIELTPNHCDVDGFPRYEDESLGDQTGNAGTDADVAIFYESRAGARGVILIETKYIEDGFSTCKSYEKKVGLRATCDGPEYHERLIRPHLRRPSARPECGYLRYRNWAATSVSRLLDAGVIATAAACPFRGSAQQIWRNLLLAERIAAARRLDACHFWVLAPSENTELWKDAGAPLEPAVRKLLTPDGNAAFRRLALRRDVTDILAALVGPHHRTWLADFIERYVPTG